MPKHRYESARDLNTTYDNDLSLSYDNDLSLTEEMTGGHYLIGVALAMTLWHLYMVFGGWFG